MTRRLGVVMDPIAKIKPEKDTSLAILLEAAKRGWGLDFLEVGDLRIRDGRAEATVRSIEVRDAADWCTLGAPADVALSVFDVVLMRKDPPVDMEYVAATYVLDRAVAAGVLVVNSPSALRDANEKVMTAAFPQCSPPGLVTRSMEAMHGFVRQHGAVVFKPLFAMGGRGVYVVRTGDPNANVIVEEVTAHGTRFAMAQAYVPDVQRTGDKRILLIDGVPVEHAIARMPAPGESRANIAAGGSVQPATLTDRDRWLCAQVGPALRDMGLLFVGLDVIGDYITEINVTSPTCVREIDRAFGVNVAAQVMDAIESRLPSNRANN